MLCAVHTVGSLKNLGNQSTQPQKGLVHESLIQSPSTRALVMLKRTFDILVSLFLLLILSPLFICSIIIIWTYDWHSPFYFGMRVGRGGDSFLMLKLRSMRVDADKLPIDSTSATDPRITPVGHFIRRFKLDELAQLWNVLIGDMSLVGPRPEVQKFVDLYTDDEKIILTVRPGITDWSSIKFHNEPEIIAASGILDADEAYAKLIRPDKLRLQRKYVLEHNFFIDIQILCSTVVTLFSTRLGGGPIGVPSNY